jgi:hypothetical protein
MADATTPQNTHKDPITGEMVSKKCAFLTPKHLAHLSLFVYPTVS